MPSTSARAGRGRRPPPRGGRRPRRSGGRARHAARPPARPGPALLGDGRRGVVVIGQRPASAGPRARGPPREIHPTRPTGPENPRAPSQRGAAYASGDDQLPRGHPGPRTCSGTRTRPRRPGAGERPDGWAGVEAVHAHSLRSPLTMSTLVRWATCPHCGFTEDTTASGARAGALRPRARPAVAGPPADGRALGRRGGRAGRARRRRRDRPEREVRPRRAPPSRTPAVAAERVRLTKLQAPHRGAARDLRPAAGATDQERLAARAALVKAVEGEITRDAQARVRAGEIEGRSADTVRPFLRAPDAVPDDRVLSKRIGRYDCIAVVTTSRATPAHRSGASATRSSPRSTSAASPTSGAATRRRRASAASRSRSSASTAPASPRRAARSAPATRTCRARSGQRFGGRAAFAALTLARACCLLRCLWRCGASPGRSSGRRGGSWPRARASP